jgi:hypothetical protein
LKDRKLYIFLFLVLVAISSYDFYNYVEEEGFFRFKFDLSKTEQSNKSEYVLTDYSYSSVTLKGKALDLKPYVSYEMKFADTNNSYVFAYEEMEVSNQKILLNGLVWYFKKPIEKSQSILISEIKLIDKTHPKFTIAMITEQFGCCLMFGEQMRFQWNKKNTNIGFVGNKNDVYSYPYYGGENISSIGIYENSLDVEKADNYIIWTGRNESNSKKLIKNLEETFKNLNKINPRAKIILMYPAPSPVLKIDKKISENVKALRNFNFEEITVIDIYALLKNREDWREYYFEYDYALSKQAYDIILDKLNNEIN